MKMTKIQSNDRSVHLDCAWCDNWEEIGIEEPRKKLNSMPIIRWNPDVCGENEKSIHVCNSCEMEFGVEWDYENPIGREWIEE
tara:strand:- start:384 stop:632 length:249 start_codon:yes stop_codon:yes gene_type:complete